MRKITSRIYLSTWRAVFSALGLYATLLTIGGLMPVTARAQTSGAMPTVVLVHGAFADSSSWDGVVSRLLAKGYPVVAIANPLRSLRTDAAYVAAALDAIPGPVVLVGHSYGGSVISGAATGKTNVKALVFVSGFALDEGESTAELGAKYPGSTLAQTLTRPTVLADGSKDLYIEQSKFHDQFAADVPMRETVLMGVAQRPIIAAAFDEVSGPPAWKNVPSWFIYGTLDKNIPPAVQPFMAQRANAKKIVSVKGGSHVVMISHPDLVANLIQEAAAATVR